ncbi:MAG TPA: anthranilate synthase component I, partial [Brevundimonas sp.]
MTSTDSAAAFQAFRDGWSSDRPQVVVRRLVDDLETPVSAFLKVGRGRAHAFLLESVEGGAVNGRYSIITREPDVVWRCRDRRPELARGGDIAAGRFAPDGDDALASL